MKKISTDLKYLISIWVILILAIIPTYAHHGHLILDCGREVYYPTQILLGKVLYKDLFNIYGPFSYMFNALLFKIFGVNLNVLYGFGCVCAFSITTLIYLISKRFLSKFLSFSIAVYTVCLGVLTLNLFNFIFPYSYGMLYGIVAFMASVWLLLKYVQTPKSLSYLYLSSFFVGLCVTSKYEFLPYLIVILYAVFKVKPLNLKEYFYTIASFLFVPVFCFGVLFWQGLNFQDLINTAKIIKTMAQTQTLKYFYITQGVCFDKKTIGFLLLNLVKTAVPLFLFCWGVGRKNKFLAVSLIVVATCLMATLTSPVTFSFLPILILVSAVFNFKNLIKNKALTILVLSGLTISLKSFWGLATLNYGLFFVSFLIVAFLALIFDIWDKKNSKIIHLFPNSPFHQIVGVYILIIAMILGCQELAKLKFKQYKIETSRGEIYTNEYLYGATNELIKYIDKNTKKTDTVVIFPEGMVINFLTNRKTDDLYNSLIPLYVETFGEEKIIQHFKETKPEYIIFNNWNTGDYYFKYIGSDYAVAFCNFVATNYVQEKVIDSGFRYLIFKRK